MTPLPDQREPDDGEIRFDGTDWREVPEWVWGVMHDAITESVNDHLRFNAMAYGNPWTGEYEDSRFIASGAAEKAIAALYDGGHRVVEHKRATPDEQSAKEER